MVAASELYSNCEQESKSKAEMSKIHGALELKVV